MGSLPIGGIKLEIGGDIKALRDAVRDGKLTVDDLGKFLEQRLDKSATSAERSVARLVKELTGVRPSAQLTQLAVAVEKIGGTSKLTEIQVGNLARRIESLRAAGGAVPASLNGITTSVSGMSSALSNIKTDGLQRLVGMASRLGPVGSTMTALGPAGMVAAAGVTAVAAAALMLAKTLADATSAAVRHASAVADGSARAQMGAEAYQTLALSGSLVGSTAETMVASVHKLNDALVNSPEKIEKLGLSAAALRAMAPEEQFRAIAEALQGIEDPAYRDVLAIDILGNKASEVTLLMKAFGEGGAARFRELGAVMDADTVAALDRVDDSLTVLEKTWEGFWNNVGAAIVESGDVAGVIDGITDSIGALSRMVRESSFIGSQLRGAFKFFGATTGLGQLPAIGQFLRNRDFQNYNLPGTFGADAAAAGGDGTGKDAGMLGSAVGDYEEFIKLNPAVLAAITKIREERKKLTEETKKATEEEKKLRDRMKEISGSQLAARMDFDTKAIERMGGYAKIAADQLERMAKAYAGTSHAVPFWMEIARRGAQEQEPGLVLPDGFRAAGMSPAAQRMIERSRQTAFGALRADGRGSGLDSLAPGLVLPPGFNESRPLEYGSMKHMDFLAQAKGFESFAAATDDVKRNIEASVKATEQGSQAQAKWTDLLAAAADFAQLLGLNPDSGLGRGLAGAGSAMAAGKGFKDALKFDTAGNIDWSKTNKAQAGMAGIAAGGGIVQGAGGAGNGRASVGMGALQGGIQGGMFGAQFGPLGAVIGAGAGALVGGVTASLMKHANAFEHVGKHWGKKISDGMALQIDEDAKEHFGGNVEAASLSNLKGIFDDAGGLGKFGVDEGTGKVRDLFSQIDQGTMTLEQASEAFDSVFGDVAAAHISETTGIASDQFRELIALAQDFGIESKALKEFLSGQAKGFSSNLGSGLGSFKGLREKGVDVGITDQGAASAFSDSLAGQFAAMRANGMSLSEALREIAPTVQTLREELTAAGLEGTAAFAALEHQVAIAGGEITGPLVSGVGSFAMAAVNLHNVNALTQESFSALTGQIGKNILALEEQGVTGPASIAALQPDLQKIWELQQRYGFEVDATTQKLLDEAVAGGQVGEQHRSASEKMLEASERTAKAVEFLAEKFGYLATVLDKLPAKKEINIHTKYTSSGSPSDSDSDGVPDGRDKYPDDPEKFRTGTLGSGSLVRNFGTETLAALHGHEAVMTVPQLERLASNSFTAGVAGAAAQLGGGVPSLDTSRLEARLDRMAHEQSLLREAIRVSVRDAVLQVQQ